MKRDPVAGWASIALGLGIAANAVLGPLVLGVIRIRESANMENQLLGGELTSLLLAAPLAVAAGVLWLRGHPAAPVAAIAPAGYSLYTYVQFVLVPDYERYSGNNEQWFPLYLALVLLGWTLAWRAWSELSARRVALPSERFAKLFGTLLVVVNGVFALAWLTSIAAMLAVPRAVEYVEHPTAFWLIRLMDLAFVIPLGITTGVALLRREAWAARAAYAYGGVETLLACAVAGMAIRMTIRGDPGVMPAMLGISAGGAVAFLVCYVLLIRGAVREGGSYERETRRAVRETAGGRARADGGDPRAVGGARTGLQQ